MAITPHILEQLAILTTNRDIEQLHTRLLEVLHELFATSHILLVGLDHNDTWSFIKCHDAQHGVIDCSDQGALTPVPRAEALEVLRSAQLHHPAYSTHSTPHYQFMACPLLEIAPWQLSLVMAFRPTDPLPDTAMLHGVLQVYRNFCLLLDDAQRDQLTGLLNRRTFDQNIHRVIQRVVEYNAAARVAHERRQHALEMPSASHWLGMIDIDFFKKINDCFGHLYGDEVLLLMAQMLRDNFRATDLIYRFGGEEFVVITTNANMHGSEIAFERLRQTIARHHFPQVGYITISFGAVEVVEGTIAHTLLDRADQALYYAKENGRNQGHYYEDLVARGLIQPVQEKTGDVELF